MIQYDPVFEQQPSATETVTAIRESDGIWCIVDCFVW